MKFDTFSILLASSVICCCLSLLFWTAHRLLRLPDVVRFWGGALGCYGIGLILLLSREYLPILGSPLVVNAFLIGCYALLLHGILIYCGKKIDTILTAGVLLLFMAVIYYFSFIFPSLAFRIIILRVFIVGFLFAIIRKLSCCRPQLSLAEKIVLFAFAFDAVQRAAILVFQAVRINDSASLYDSIVIPLSTLCSLIGLTSIGFALALMVMEGNAVLLRTALAESRQLADQIGTNERRLQALLDITHYKSSDIRGLLDFALHKVIEVTQSKIGYIYHYYEDRQEFVLNTWSKEVMPACGITDYQSVYRLEHTGIWGEVVRQRRPIMINDFGAPNPLKKGYPEGHVQLERFLSVPVFDHSDRIIAVVGVANKQSDYDEQDVRQLTLMMQEVWRIVYRLELEFKLEAISQQWRATFDAISDSVCLLDAEQKIIRCNHASKVLFGRDYDQIIGHCCWELVHGADGPIENCPMQRAARTLKTEVQTIKQGDRWLRITVDPITNEQGKIVSAVHIVHDDTERVQTEAAQRELTTVLGAVHNELYLFDPQTLAFEYVNGSAQRNLGYTREQLATLNLLDIKADIDRENFDMLSAPLLHNEQEVIRFETVNKRQDGSAYPVEVNLQTVETSRGLKFLSVVYDITERKKAEQKLLEMQAQLLQNEKMALIGQLSAGIAHEINNPIGFINSNLGTLAKYIDKFELYIRQLEKCAQESASPEQMQAAAELSTSLKLDYVRDDIHRLLAESAEGVERVMRIVRDLKNFSRNDMSQMSSSNINQCLDSTINIVWNELKYVAELQREYGELPKVVCNIQQINQVFMNLLVNAGHAIAEKGLGEPGTITVRTWNDDESCYVAISDSGVGITEELRNKIFDPFFTTKDVGKGTGLGLSISNEIVKKHGGEILVASEKGVGTTFTVRLPLVQQDSTMRNG